MEQQELEGSEKEYDGRYFNKWEGPKQSEEKYRIHVKPRELT